MQKNNFTFEEIKQKLINYCVYQDRCHSEVEQKMREFILIPEAKDEILLFLITENYLSEERFTRSYIRGKFYIKNWGRNKIKTHLKQKNIPEKLISKCFDEIDEKDYQNTISRLYETYFSKLKNLKEYQKKIKTIRYLLSKGFEYEEINLSIDEG
jgi:regulatory protein